MTTQMIVRINSEIKEKLSKLARMEGKTSSQMVRELIEGYIKERDISAYIDGLWDSIGERLINQGVTQADIAKAIKETRESR